MNSPIITVSNLQKHFKVCKHHRGAFGAFRNLFSREYERVHAVDGIRAIMATISGMLRFRKLMCAPFWQWSRISPG